MDFLFTSNVSILTLICWHRSISESEHCSDTGHQPHMSSHQGEELALWGEMGRSLKIENLFPLLERLLKVLFSLLFWIFCSIVATVCRNRRILVCGESLQDSSSSCAMTLPSLEAHFHRNVFLSATWPYFCFPTFSLSLWSLLLRSLFWSSQPSSWALGSSRACPLLPSSMTALDCGLFCSFPSFYPLEDPSS